MTTLTHGDAREALAGIPRGLFSSLRTDWRTPANLFRWLDSIFHFTLDVCANAENAQMAPYLTPESDALSQPWRGVCWMNPPYGRSLGRWIQKAWDSAQRGATVVCLLPARTDTAWWHDYCMKGDVRFLRGRLYFDDGGGRAPFPSAIVIFWPPGACDPALPLFASEG